MTDIDKKTCEYKLHTCTYFDYCRRGFDTSDCLRIRAVNKSAVVVTAAVYDAPVRQKLALASAQATLQIGQGPITAIRPVMPVTVA